MTEIVRLRDIGKGFKDGEQYHLVLQSVELVINRGDTLALTGPSGSGKSTLLNLIAGFERADTGELELLARDTRGWQDRHWSEFRRRDLGMVFQGFNLLTPLNVRDNIGFPLSLTGQSWTAWCDHLVASLELDTLLGRHVETLSGGQQQRVAIARALAHRPALLLADEPTGNLDSDAAKQVMTLLCELAAQSHTSVLMVTHSLGCAAFMHRRWHLEQGKIRE